MPATLAATLSDILLKLLLSALWAGLIYAGIWKVMLPLFRDAKMWQREGHWIKALVAGYFAVATAIGIPIATLFMLVVLFSPSP